MAMADWTKMALHDAERASGRTEAGTQYSQCSQSGNQPLVTAKDRKPQTEPRESDVCSHVAIVASGFKQFPEMGSEGRPRHEAWGAAEAYALLTATLRDVAKAACNIPEDMRDIAREALAAWGKSIQRMFETKDFPGLREVLWNLLAETEAMQEDRIS